jgi:hypothetical protein
VGWTRKRSADENARVLGRKPLARSEELVIEEVGSELLIYDQTNNQAHSLGTAAASVWRACDGDTDAEGLQSATGLDKDTVLHALEELRECRLLDEGPVSDAGMTRRTMGIKAAKIGGAAAATPLIVSLLAPMPAAAATVTPAFCTNGGTSFACGVDCQSRHCCCCCQTTGGVQLTGGAEGFCGTTGNTKCCLPTAQCNAGAFGPTGHCSDTAACP